MSKRKMKTLIVEDQKYPLEALADAITKVLPKITLPGRFTDFTRTVYDVAKCYSRAEEHINRDSYDIVLLDHRIPYEDQGDLEDKDFDRFSASLKNIGYNLIPKIKSRSPTTIVIGTSSLSEEELRRLPSPDFTMRKQFGKAEEDLERILKQISEGGRIK